MPIDKQDKYHATTWSNWEVGNCLTHYLVSKFKTYSASYLERSVTQYFPSYFGADKELFFIKNIQNLFNIALDLPSNTLSPQNVEQLFLLYPHPLDQAIIFRTLWHALSKNSAQPELAGFLEEPDQFKQLERMCQFLKIGATLSSESEAEPRVITSGEHDQIELFKLQNSERVQVKLDTGMPAGVFEQLIGNLPGKFSFAKTYQDPSEHNLDNVKEGLRDLILKDQIYREFDDIPELPVIENENSIHAIALRGDVDALEKYKASLGMIQRNVWSPINARDAHQHTPLHYAVMAGHLSIVKEIVKDSDSEAFKLAVQYRQESIIKYLLYRQRFSDWRPPTEHLSDILIDRGKSPIAVYMRFQRQAQRENKIYLVKIAISESSDIALFHNISRREVDVIGANGETALHVAARNNNVMLGLKLLELGANPFLKSKNGRLPLHEAVESGSIAFLKFLTSYMLEKKREYDDALSKAYTVSKLTWYKLYAKINFDPKDKYNVTPLSLAHEKFQLAKEHGEAESTTLYLNIMQILWEAGARQRSPDSMFITALMGGDESTVRQLLTHYPRLKKLDIQNLADIDIKQLANFLHVDMDAIVYQASAKNYLLSLNMACFSMQANMVQAILESIPVAERSDVIQLRNKAGKTGLNYFEQDIFNTPNGLDNAVKDWFLAKQSPHGKIKRILINAQSAQAFNAYFSGYRLAEKWHRWLSYQDLIGELTQTKTYKALTAASLARPIVSAVGEYAILGGTPALTGIAKQVVENYLWHFGPQQITQLTNSYLPTSVSGVVNFGTSWAYTGYDAYRLYTNPGYVIASTIAGNAGLLAALSITTNKEALAFFYYCSRQSPQLLSDFYQIAQKYLTEEALEDNPEAKIEVVFDEPSVTSSDEPEGERLPTDDPNFSEIVDAPVSEPIEAIEINFRKFISEIDEIAQSAVELECRDNEHCEIEKQKILIDKFNQLTEALAFNQQPLLSTVEIEAHFSNGSEITLVEQTNTLLNQMLNRAAKQAASFPADSENTSKHLVTVTSWLYMLAYGSDSLNNLSQDDEIVETRLSKIYENIGLMASSWSDKDLREYYLSKVMKARVDKIAQCQDDICIDALNEDIEGVFQALYPMQMESMPKHLDTTMLVESVNASIEPTIDNGLRDKIIADQLGGILTAYEYHHCEQTEDSICQTEKNVFYNRLLESKQVSGSWESTFTHVFSGLKLDVLSSIVHKSNQVAMSLDAESFSSEASGESTEISMEQRDSFQAYRLAAASLNWQNITYSEEPDSFYQKRINTISAQFYNLIYSGKGSENNHLVVRDLLEKHIRLPEHCQLEEIDACVEAINDEVAVFVITNAKYANALSEMPKYQDSLLKHLGIFSHSKKEQILSALESDKRQRYPSIAVPLFKIIDESTADDWRRESEVGVHNDKIKSERLAKIIISVFFPQSNGSNEALYNRVFNVIYGNLKNNKGSFTTWLQRFVVDDLLAREILNYYLPFAASNEPMSAEIIKIMGDASEFGISRRESIAAWFSILELDKQISTIEGATQLSDDYKFYLFREIKHIFNEESDKPHRISSFLRDAYEIHAPGDYIWDGCVLGKSPARDCLHSVIQDNIVNPSISFAEGVWPNSTKGQRLEIGQKGSDNLINTALNMCLNAGFGLFFGYNFTPGFLFGIHKDYLNKISLSNESKIKPNFTNLIGRKELNRLRTVQPTPEERAELVRELSEQTRNFIRQSEPIAHQNMMPYPHLEDILEHKGVRFPTPATTMPDVSDERTAPVSVQTVVEKNPVIEPMTASQSVDIQDAPIQKPDSLDKKILSAAISAIGKVMGTAHGATTAIPVPVPLPVPLPLPKLMNIPAVPLSQYRYTYEERADIQFAAEEQARSSANSQAHLPEDIYSTFSVENDAVSSGWIGGRTIHEQLPQRLETPIEQPGDTGNILIFPTLQEQLDQRLETPIDKPGDTGNIMILPVLAPSAILLNAYLRTREPENIDDRQPGNAWDPKIHPISKPRPNPLDPAVESNTGRLYIPHEKHMPINGGRAARWQDASIDPIPNIEIGQKLLDTAFKHDRYRDVTKGPLFTYYNGKIIEFRSNNHNNEWHAYEVNKNVENAIGSDVLAKFKDAGLINKAEYKKLIKL